MVVGDSDGESGGGVVMAGGSDGGWCGSDDR